MEEKPLTELANEIGVSKPAIYNKISDEEKEKWFTKRSNKFFVSLEGQKEIRERFKHRLNENQNRKEDNKQSKSEKLLIEQLMKDKEDLLKQVNEFQTTVQQTQKLLDQQQQLHLQANQRIEHLEKQLAIEPPEEETTAKKDDEAIQSYEEKIQELEKQVAEDEKINAELYGEYERLSKLEKEWNQQATNKKWFQFWKR